MHELQIRFPLIRNERCILPRETGIMLNRIMQIQFRQIETTSPVRTIEEISRELGHEEAEGGGKVECVPDFGVEFSKGDVLPVVREYTVVGHGVERRAG